MSMPEADIAIPREDGAIQEALADLDKKLSTHAVAVRDAERRLREMLSPREEPAGGEARVPNREMAQQEPPSHAPHDTPHKAAASPATTSRVLSARLKNNNVGSAAAKSEAASPVVEKEKKPEAAVEGAEAATPVAQAAAKSDTHRDGAEATESPAATQARAEPEPSGAASHEEEALLASLDEATAKAVRVQRRLNPGKSVQELLKQVDKHKDGAGPAPKAAAKSWFRRR